MGIAVLPTRLAHDDVQRRHLARIEVDGFGKDGFGKHTICATIAQQNEREPRIKEVIRLLKGHFR